MPTFQVRNRLTKMVLGEVTVDSPIKVIDGMKEATGFSIEEIAKSLGSTIEEAEAALDIVVMKFPRLHEPCQRVLFDPLPRKRLFC